jgi:hypothetical protein
MPSELEGPVVSRHRGVPFDTIDTLELPPTAGERVPGVVSEYLRVCGAVLTVNVELGLVDPFLDLCNDAHACVIIAFLKRATESGNCLFVRMWALESRQTQSTEKIGQALRKILGQSGKPRNGVKLSLVRDGRTDKIHARYLFGIHSGVKLEYGFQEFRDRRPVDVSPMDKRIHDRAIKTFLEDAGDFKVSQVVR